jgi:hypothetical protein
MMQEKVPAVLGVPEIRPVVESNASPVGREPELTDQLYGVVPPVAVTLAEYPAPTCPFGRDEVVIVGATAAAFTVSVAAALVAVPAVLLTTTWNVDPLSDVVVAGVA